MPKATFIKVMIYREKNYLVMSIQNDGANLPVSSNEPRKGGKGTKSMQSRAEALNGNFKIHKNDSYYQVFNHNSYKIFVICSNGSHSYSNN